MHFSTAFALIGASAASASVLPRQSTFSPPFHLTTNTNGLTYGLKNYHIGAGDNILVFQDTASVTPDLAQFNATGGLSSLVFDLGVTPPFEAFLPGLPEGQSLAPVTSEPGLGDAVFEVVNGTLNVPMYDYGTGFWFCSEVANGQAVAQLKWGPGPATECVKIEVDVVYVE